MSKVFTSAFNTEKNKGSGAKSRNLLEFGRWLLGNGGFESGDFSPNWDEVTSSPASAVEIQSAAKHSGTYAAKIVSVGSTVDGPRTVVIPVDATKTYWYKGWSNVTARSAGTHLVRISYYSDAAGTTPCGSDPDDDLGSWTATTDGWVEVEKSIGPSGGGADFTFPVDCVSIKILARWDSTPTGTAYLDDVEFWEEALYAADYNITIGNHTYQAIALEIGKISEINPGGRTRATKQKHVLSHDPNSRLDDVIKPGIEMRYYAWFDGLDEVDRALMFKGIVSDNIRSNYAQISLVAVDTLVKHDKLIGTLITLDDWPNADPEDVGKIIPEVIGDVRNLPVPALVAAGVAVLDADISDSDTTVTCTDNSRFAASGSFWVGDELISYASKADAQTFSSCTRGTGGTIAVLHTKGERVVEYIDLKYGCSAKVPKSITNPRIIPKGMKVEDAVSLDPDDITITLDDSGIGTLLIKKESVRSIAQAIKIIQQPAHVNNPEVHAHSETANITIPVYFDQAENAFPFGPDEIVDHSVNASFTWGGTASSGEQEVYKVFFEEHAGTIKKIQVKARVNIDATFDWEMWLYVGGVLKINETDTGESSGLRTINTTMTSLSGIDWSDLVLSNTYAKVVTDTAGDQDHEWFEIWLEVEYEPSTETLLVDRADDVVIGGNSAGDALGTAVVDIEGAADGQIEANDQFVEASDTELSLHTPDMGTGWTQLVTAGVGNVDIEIKSADNTIQPDLGGAARGSLYELDDTISQPNYSVSVEMVNGDNSDETNQIAARIQDANNMYAVRFNEDGGQLYKRVAGSWSTLGASFGAIANGATVALIVFGTTISVEVDGVEKVSVTDSAHTGAGKAGVGMGAVIVATDDMADQELDNFNVTLLSDHYTGTLGALIEEHEDVFHYLVEAYGNKAYHEDIDHDSLTDAGTLPASYKWGFAITKQIMLSQLLSELCPQAWCSWVIEAGKFRMLRKKTISDAADKSLVLADERRRADKIPRSYFDWSNLVDIRNLVEVLYDFDNTKRDHGNAEAYEEVTAPEEDSDSQDRYGEKALKRIFWAISWGNSTMAEDLRDKFLADLKEPRKIITMQIHIDQMGLERGDQVDFSLGHLDLTGYKGEIVGTIFEPCSLKKKNGFRGIITVKGNIGNSEFGGYGASYGTSYGAS